MHILQDLQGQREVPFLPPLCTIKARRYAERKTCQIKGLIFILLDFPGGSDGKASAYNVGDPGSIPRSGRSSGEGNGNPLQYSCLENPMDGGAW